MHDQLSRDVDRYITEQLIGDDAALTFAEASMASAGLPPIAVSPAQGKLLYLLARVQRARRVLEIGTLGGYSAIWLGKALPADGQIISLEVNPHYAEVAMQSIARAGLTSRVEVRVGSAIDTLPQLASEGAGPFDLVFIDADKPSTPVYFQWALRLSRPGSLIIVDNVVRGGAIVDPDSTDEGALGMRRFHEMLRSASGVEATTIQTVGLKGYDGFALALVTAGAGRG